MSNYHRPVLLEKCIEALSIQSEGVYIDATFGGGGHSKAILKVLKDKGKLIAFDQDKDAALEAEKVEAANFQFIAGNFRHLEKFLKLYKVEKVDGILADLGVSSHQFDTAERGFSIRFEGDLDMRMDKSTTLTAERIINEYAEKDLHKIFGMYGEVRNAKTLANTLLRARARKSIRTTFDLLQVLKPLAPRQKPKQYYAQVFQALRIEANDELGALEDFLLQSATVMKKGARLVIMSYHSLEDRLVKSFIQKGKFFGEVEKDIYGNFEKPFEAANRKPITASEAEIERNPRARSAKLRIAKKI